MVDKVGQFWIVLCVALVCVSVVVITALIMGHDGVLLNTYLTLVGAITGGGGVYGYQQLRNRRDRRPPQ